MAKKTVKKTVKKVAPSDAPGGRPLRSKADRDKAKAASDKAIKDAADETARRLKAAKAKVEKGLEVGRQAIDLALKRVTSELRLRLSTKEQVEYVGSMDDKSVAHEVVRLVMSEMTKLNPEDL